MKSPLNAGADRSKFLLPCFRPNSWFPLPFIIKECFSVLFGHRKRYARSAQVVHLIVRPITVEMHTLHPGSQCNQNSYKIVFMEPAHQPPHDTPRAHSTLLHLLSSRARARACFLCGRARARLTEGLLRLLVGWPPSSLPLGGFTPLSQWIDNSWRGLPLPLCTLLHQSDRLTDTHDAFHPRESSTLSKTSRRS